jgi:hypothetical protein
MSDLRTAVRELRATPLVTAVAVLSLALGIGANTAIFSLTNALLVRSLPVVDPQRLPSSPTRERSIVRSSRPGRTAYGSRCTIARSRSTACAPGGASD